MTQTCWHWLQKFNIASNCYKTLFDQCCRIHVAPQLCRPLYNHQDVATPVIFSNKLISRPLSSSLTSLHDPKVTLVWTTCCHTHSAFLLKHSAHIKPCMTGFSWMLLVWNHMLWFKKNTKWVHKERQCHSDDLMKKSWCLSFDCKNSMPKLCPSSESTHQVVWVCLILPTLTHTSNKSTTSGVASTIFSCNLHEAIELWKATW